MLIQHTSRFHGILLTVANILIPISILVFATGFFPYKPFLPGLAQYEDLDYGPPPEAPFDRLVFMVVDALRSDFVYTHGSGFTFTQELIRKGHALPFTANARSPTITMPRIKAITTGSIPSFLDVILNFDEADTSSTLAAQDTWLAQMKAKATGKLVMYGDDTWLKLFPETFDRAEGTSSFFVSDFTEVDNNVTRHVPDELRNDDWNTLVLHYLGLDHIGHKAGPLSPNMEPKQREMDGIVSQVYTAMTTHEHLSSTLLVLCGDHGMNDAGNHGASSPGETSPALVFISPKLGQIAKDIVSPAPFEEDFGYYTKVEQSDLAPTLGALLGFPVPQNNLGALITDFLPFWPRGNDKIQLILRNARQILKIVANPFGNDYFEKLSDQQCADPSDDSTDLACEWRALDQQRQSFNGDAGDVDDVWLSAACKWLSKAQDLMSSMASNYDLGRLILGQTVALVAFSLVLAIITPSASLVPLLLVALLYGIMMFASSYVEEEHHFWYWMTTAWLASLMASRLRSLGTMLVLAQSMLALVATRLVRGWNQTGQKHAGEPDIVKSFLVAEPSLLWLLVGATYLLIGVQIHRRLIGLPSALSFGVALFLVGSASTFKLAFTHEDAPELVIYSLEQANTALEGLSLVFKARVVFIGLGGVAAYSFYLVFRKSREANQVARLFHSLYTLLAITQSRTANIPLFLLFQFQETFVSSLDLNIAGISTTSVLLQYMSFFAFGGTNAISSVDLSSAYNGVSGFNVVGVGILTFVSNWAGAIYWSSATNLMLLNYKKRHPGSRGVFAQHIVHLTLFATGSVTLIMAACNVLRTHLFIWTVFSPKYLYCMAWSIGQHIIINILVAGGLYGLVASP